MKRARGKGCAQNLIKHAMGDAEEVQLIVTKRETQKAARALYKKLGFVAGAARSVRERPRRGEGEMGRRRRGEGDVYMYACVFPSKFLRYVPLSARRSAVTRVSVGGSVLSKISTHTKMWHTHASRAVGPAPCQ